MSNITSSEFFDQLAVVIAAAGIGKRFSSKRNKLFISVGDNPVFIHTLKNVISFIRPENIFLSINYKFKEKYLEVLEEYIDEKILSSISIIQGGETRMHSVYNALKIIPESIKYTAVHDAARPYADFNIFYKCLSAAQKFGSAVPAKQITDTIKRSNKDNFIIENINRENVWAVETPQIFLRQKLLAAYLFAFENKLSSTDDAGIMEYSGFQPYIVANSEFNGKITFTEDIVPFQERQGEPD